MPPIAARTNARADRLRHDLTQAFAKPSPELAASPLYLLGLMLTAGVVLLLPVLYVALIAVVAWLVYWHATAHVYWLGLIHGRGALLMLMLYGIPLVAGPLVVLFMLKPLIAPRSEPELGPTLDRDEQPALFALIDGLCETLGAPVPRRVEVRADVNAAAAFRNGLWSVFRRGDLILMIGLPLAAGLNVRDFAGVLAHEFGHFRQGLAMRLSYVVRRVNGWFARVVYQRDDWDVALDDGTQSEYGWVIFFCLFLKLAVAITRGVLWVLMMVSHAVSGFVSRQMEYDADAAAVLVAGQEHTGRVLTELTLLNGLFGDTLENPDPRLAPGELHDNIPEFVAEQARLVDSTQRAALRDRELAEKTGLFDTHPSLRARDRHARGLDLPGVLADTAFGRPARDLFADFRPLSKAVTYAFYREHLGDALEERRLRPTKDLIAEVDAAASEHDGLTEFVGGVLDRGRPPRLALKPVTAPQDPKAVVSELRQARARLQQHRDEAAAALNEADTVRRAWMRAEVLCEVLRAHPERAKQVLAGSRESARELERVVAECPAKLKAANARRLTAYDGPLTRRVDAALALLASPAIRSYVPEHRELRPRAEALAATATRLAAVAAAMDTVDRVRAKQEALMALLPRLGQRTKLVSAMRVGEQALRSGVATLAQRAEGLRYPEPGEATGTDDGFELLDEPDAPDTTDEGAYDLNPETVAKIEAEKDHRPRGDIADDLRELNLRVLRELAEIVVRVEEALGVGVAKAKTAT